MERADVDGGRAGELPSAEFLATLAYELRTPLSALRVSFDLLRDPSAANADAEEHRRLVETIGRSLQRLEQHITDMLEIGYLNNNTLGLRSERIDVGTPVVAALDATRQHAVQRRVAIDLTLEQDLPQFRADPGRLAQVLTNLLLNAIRLSPIDGSVVLDVSTAPTAVDEARKEGGEGGEDSLEEGPRRPEEMIFSVSDRGPGLAEEYAEKVFWPFYPVPRRHSDGVAGAGLGLAIARSLVELHGGSMWVESDGEEGTTFRFSVPIGQDDEDTGS